MGSMVKALEQEIYPRSVKLTIVNDSTIVAFAQSPENTMVSKKLYLIQRNSPYIKIATIDSMYIVDVKSYGNMIFFCGSIPDSSVIYGKLGCLAKTTIHNLFNAGVYQLIPIFNTSIINRMEPYVDDIGAISVACYGDRYLIKCNMNSYDYYYASLPVHDNCTEFYSDLIIYKNYIALLSTYTLTNNSSFFGCFLRLFDKTTLNRIPSIPNKIQINNSDNHHPYTPLLAKSEINNDIYIATVPLLTTEDTIASIIDINRINITSNGLQNCTRYRLTLDSIYFNILWNVKSNNKGSKSGLYLLTTQSDRNSRVLYFDLTDTINKPVNIFEYFGHYDFYTSLDVYNNSRNFICVGGNYNTNGDYNFSSWEKI